MDKEIKYPMMDKPDFITPPFDYRNYEDAGKYRGHGQIYRMGSREATSINTMPSQPNVMKVPRDHEG